MNSLKKNNASIDNDAAQI